MTPEVSARNLTTLAWRRTLLRWVVVAVVAARVFSDTVGIEVIIVAFATITVAAAISLHLARAFASSKPDAVYSPVPRLAILGLGTLAVGLAAAAWLAFR